jgi:hypothetical protein
MASLISGDTFFLDEFALRQWDDPDYGGTRISYDKSDFVARLHDAHMSGEAPLHDGYSDFCKVASSRPGSGSASSSSSPSGGRRRRRPQQQAPSPSPSQAPTPVVPSRSRAL